ncbi:two-component system response regulator [Thiomicrospira sp. ALE5]|uniref:response regulator n=1 Tax=Thiomicrospira sp. ALE5 TaxID=748650 RepID=UPI0008E5F6DA|nr:two-component system response regulator [Thiomicrospira sp. ALE5]SFR51502.1 putative two-component system response regulator [Thiomicrospira sp. ALE5]
MSKPIILCVDDTPANLTLLNGLLEDEYSVKSANSGIKALKLLEKITADLVLLDVMMPDMDGYEVCQQIKTNPATQSIPVLFITALNEPEDEEKALAVGGNDFITKPINPSVLQARIRTQLQLKRYNDSLRQQNNDLEAKLEKRLSDIYHLQDASLSVMISLAEFRDEDTGMHIKRTQHFVRLIAQQAQRNLPHLQLNDSDIELMTRCAPLHDVGKITIPDHILLKPGKLTDDEFAVMKSHAQRGYDILEAAAKSMGSYGDYLDMAKAIAISHHEKWDGSGYPNQLAGTSIPLAGRLMALADVYDALRSSRPYKQPSSHDKALEIMQDMSEKHFDPELFACFVRVESEVLAISQQWAD